MKTKLMSMVLAIVVLFSMVCIRISGENHNVETENTEIEIASSNEYIIVYDMDERSRVEDIIASNESLSESVAQ